MSDSVNAYYFTKNKNTVLNVTRFLDGIDTQNAMCKNQLEKQVLKPHKKCNKLLHRKNVQRRKCVLQRCH